MVQCHICLLLTGVIKKPSRDRVYQQLGLEFLADQRWSRKLVFYHKITKGILFSEAVIRRCSIEHRKTPGLHALL